MYVAIDTSIFLSFFELSDSDVDELARIEALVDNRRMTLVVPQQVRDEFRRQREQKIAAAVRVLKSARIAIQVPNLYSGLASEEALIEGARELERIRRQLVVEGDEAIADGTLPADRAVGKILNAARRVAARSGMGGCEGAADEMLSRARDRCDRGNPPGKRGSLGDAIAWECLLEVVPEGEDLHLVTRDGDFSSPLPGNGPNEFLEREWRNQKRGQLYVYPNIQSFLQMHFREILDVEDAAKHLAIRRLAESSSFASTHAAIARLGKFSEFSVDEQETLLQAIATNSQVWQVIDDWDVQRFVTSLLEQLDTAVDDTLASRVRELVHSTDKGADDEEDDEWWV